MSSILAWTSPPLPMDYPRNISHQSPRTCDGEQWRRGTPTAWHLGQPQPAAVAQRCWGKLDDRPRDDPAGSVHQHPGENQPHGALRARVRLQLAPAGARQGQPGPRTRGSLRGWHHQTAGKMDTGVTPRTCSDHKPGSCRARSGCPPESANALWTSSVLSVIHHAVGVWSQRWMGVGVTVGAECEAGDKQAQVTTGVRDASAPQRQSTVCKTCHQWCSCNDCTWTEWTRGKLVEQRPPKA